MNEAEVKMQKSLEAIYRAIAKINQLKDGE